MKLLIKGFLFRIIYTIAGFLVSLLIAKLAGVSSFGILSLMIVNGAFIHILTGLGTDAAIVWHGVSAETEDKNRIFSIAVYTALLQFSLFLISAFLFFQVTGSTILSGEHDSTFFYIELLYFTGLILTEKYSALFYSQQMAPFCNKLLAVSSSILLLAGIGVYFFSAEVISNNPALIFSFFIFIPALVLFISYHIKLKPVLARINNRSINSFVNFSFIVFMSNIIQFIAFRADFWLINYFKGKVDVGIYAQASRFSQMLWIIPGVLAGLVVPALKNRSNKLSVEELVVICRVVLFTHIILGVLVTAAAFIIYQYFLPDIFFNGFPALLLMIPGYIIFTITTILAAFFSANRLLRINLLGSSLCCVLIVGLDMLLIPTYSFTGAAIANMVAYTLTTVFFIILSCRETGVSIKHFFVIRKSDFKLLSGKLIGNNQLS